MTEPRRDRPILEAVLQNVEIAVDAITANDAVASIPVIGTAFKLCKGFDDLRSKAFAAKLARFFSVGALSTPKAKAAIVAKVQSSSEEARKVGETLFLVLDRFIDLDKPELLAKLFVAYLGGAITALELQRLAQAIDIAHGNDLSDLINADASVVNGNASDATYLSWMQTLIPSGLTMNKAGGVTVVKTRNEVTPLGRLLWRAAHYELAET